jgi:galactose mutarotase-like enzyme
MPNATAQAAYTVRGGVTTGHRICTLRSHDADLQVSFAPELGMVACSMLHAGEELLGRRSGLAAYARSGATMGIPLLYPWANRLGGVRYRFAGRTAAIDGGTPLDEHGLPIHGLLGAVRGWTLTGSGADREAAWVRAELDVAQRSDLLAAFPFPHSVAVEATLRGNTLTIATTLRPTADVAVPVAFGYHPYLRLPGVPRGSWHVELPVSRRLELDQRGIPSGASEASAPIRGPLGRRTFDDAFVVAEGEGPFVLAGGGRRVELAFEEGYPYAQVFAPPDDDVVCFEPMTAPADALRGCHGPPPAVSPGDRYRGRFTITVEREP